VHSHRKWYAVIPAHKKRPDFYEIDAAVDSQEVPKRTPLATLFADEFQDAFDSDTDAVNTTPALPDDL
jgi:hypothetical protein